MSKNEIPKKLSEKKKKIRTTREVPVFGHFSRNYLHFSSAGSLNWFRIYIILST